MKKKCLFSLLLAMVLILGTVCPAYAAGQQNRMVGDGYAQGYIASTSYTVTARTSTSAKSISVTGTLYESGLFGTWHSVGSCTNSGSGIKCMASGAYTLKSGKSYKLEYSATFVYENGTSETVSGTKTQ